jgi:hypothetical protein
MDEGWTRWIFDRYGVPYATVRNEDINGDALDGFTSVLLASIPADVLRDGLEQDSLPPEFTGGLNAWSAAGRWLPSIDRSSG